MAQKKARAGDRCESCKGGKLLCGDCYAPIDDCECDLDHTLNGVVSCDGCDGRGYIDEDAAVLINSQGGYPDDDQAP